MIKCDDCYEENADTQTRCKRCGRLLAQKAYGAGQAEGGAGKDRFEYQHADAPNVMRKDREVYRFNR